MADFDLRLTRRSALVAMASLVQARIALDLDYIPAPPLGDLPKLADLIFQRLCVR